MAEFGSTLTFIIIMFVFLVTGVLMMIFDMPITLFLALGNGSGADPGTMTVIRDAIRTWFPISVMFCMIVYAWRKSRNRIE